jgi:hypothetical protein
LERRATTIRRLALVAGTGATIAACAARGVNHQAPAPRVWGEPDSARVTTSDIPRFWRAYDAARRNPAGATAAFRAYLDSGSAGLRDLAALRLGGARSLAAAVRARPRYYDAIRARTLALDTSRALRDSVHALYRRFAAHYPRALFPDVHIAIGDFGGAGTLGASGILIGAELAAADSGVPTDELTEWERESVGPETDLVHIVAHELVHAQQPAQRADGETLLAHALLEGGADFVAELVSGAHADRAPQRYGERHEAEVWAEFRADMDGTDDSRWLGGRGRHGARPADLGYFVGYAICRAYYERAADPRAALAEIITVPDPHALLAASGYAARFSQRGAPPSGRTPAGGASSTPARTRTPSR